MKAYMTLALAAMLMTSGYAAAEPDAAVKPEDAAQVGVAQPHEAEPTQQVEPSQVPSQATVQPEQPQAEPVDKSAEQGSTSTVPSADSFFGLLKGKKQPAGPAADASADPAPKQ